MTVRSIIDVDVQTAAFEKFTRLFDSYSEALRKQPDIWRRINQQHEKLAGGFAAFGNKMDEHVSGLQDLKDTQEDQDKSLTHSRSMWDDIEKSSRNTSKSIISGTTSLLKWTGLLSGVSGILGYLSVHGMMGLGSDVFGMRKSAMGLGVTTGQQRAFGIAFGRLLGSPEGFLGGISSAVSNLSQQGPLYALGVNPNASTSQVAVSTLQALRARTQGTPTNQLGILENMYQLGNLGIGVDDLRRLKSMSNPEFNQLLGTYRTQQGALSLSDKTAKGWTDFITKMDLAGARIENVFVKGLERLTGPLANLATGFTHLVEVSMSKNGGIEKDINGIASWMEKFNGQITKPEFITGLEKFVNFFTDIGTIYSRDTTPVPFSGWVNPGEVGAKARASWDDFLKPNFSGRYIAGQRIKYMQAANKTDPSGLLSTVGWLESRMNPYAPNSSKGAIGMMQLMPDVAASLGVDPSNPYQALQGAETELKKLRHDYHGDIAKTLAAYNWGEGNLNRDIAQHGNDWQRYLPAETLKYLMRAIQGGVVKVSITNATGANVTQSVSGLGAQR